MRQLAAAVAVAAIGVLVTACGGDKGNGAASSSASAPANSAKPPIAQPALANLLLSPAEIDTILGMTGTKSKEKVDKLQDDSTKQQWPAGWKWPDDCLFAFAPAEAPVYAGSGNTAVAGDDDVAALPPDSNDLDPEVTQAVVLFPSANEAQAFFTKQTQAWPVCANRQFTTPGDADNPEINWTVGAVANTNGTLTTTLSMTMSKNGNSLSMSCQRALSVHNNVAIDASGCRKDPGDVATKVVDQIAGKIDK
jgi:hypothetical protein